MPIQLSLLKKSPRVNPDKLLLKLAFSGNYTVGGDGASLVPNTIVDPLGLGITGLNVNPASVAIYEEAIGGYYTELVHSATLGGWKLQAFNAGGAELGAAPYPAAITGGFVTLEVSLADNDC